MLSQQKWTSSERNRLQQKPLFQLEQVGVHFGELKAIHRLDLVVFPREIVFITGQSGAGKTTLLHLLAGEISPTSGQIKRAHDFYPQTFTSVVFQDLRLFPSKSAEENIFYSYDEDLFDSIHVFKQEMMEYARALGALEHLNKKINECNGGMKQKIALLRALMSKPEVIILDEPTSALDRESTYKMYELLSYLNVKKGLTVLWATHNKELVKQFSGKSVHLDKGQLVFAGNACFI
jgi:cell division transport system ATP-binding protein